MGVLHKTDNGYIYDKRIFWGVILLAGLFIALLSNYYSLNLKPHFYFKCEAEPGHTCENPLYYGNCKYGFKTVPCTDLCQEEWCGYKELFPGEYGQKMPSNPLLTHFELILLVFVALGLVLNHFLHNKGKMPGFKLNVSDKLWSKIKAGASKLEEDKEE